MRRGMMNPATSYCGRGAWFVLPGSLVLILTLAACSGEKELVCRPATDYLEADSIGQLRIPNDLSVPDETESLRIPDAMAAAGREGGEIDPCLEASPAYDRND